MSKKEIWYDELSHSIAMGEGWKKGELFKQAKDDIEKIIGRPLTSYPEFKKDPLEYALKEIKASFPKPFDLGLSDDVVLGMLGIDLRLIKQISPELKNTPHVFNVCAKTGKCSASEDKTPFKWFAESKEELDRLDFAEKLADILEQAHELTPYVNKAEVTLGLTHLVYLDVQTGKFIPNHWYIKQGVK
jgi:hypothetical protein